MAIRTKDFHLDKWHGTQSPHESSKEAILQRGVFGSEHKTLQLEGAVTKKINIFGYEIPMEVPKRKDCIDLVGFDTEGTFYIIELKIAENRISLRKASEQLNRYEKKLIACLPYLQKEFQEKLKLPDFCFKDINKMLLAPIGFYLRKRHNPDSTKGILLCEFSKSDLTIDIVSTGEKQGFIEIKEVSFT
ncbi:MAG: hypothetical protein PHH43_00785 [Candidatus Cloacimonetes bacterium]|nr:hypothetical protein [Candidatus Cloacimonadota bacterium]